MAGISSERLKAEVEKAFDGENQPNRGRPPKPKYNIKYMIRELEEYTRTATIPIFKEVCLDHGWNIAYVWQLSYKNEGLSNAIKKLIARKEVILEKALYAGQNNAGIIFGLKQLGWSDRVEQVITADVNASVVNMSAEDRDRRIAELLAKKNGHD